MYHSITFAPIDMKSGDIMTYTNLGRYSKDTTDSDYAGLVKLQNGQIFNPYRPQIKNTWDDWHLLPSTRPVINPPELKSYKVNIPGGYGSLDLSEALAGHPLYENRTGSIEFVVVNDYRPWDVAFTDISNYFHGRQFKMILEDDKSYYYEGRFAVNEWKSDRNWSIITLDYDVKPFKKELFASNESWYWDSFDFETGIIRNCSKITSTLPVYIFAGREYSIPEITTNAPNTTMKVAKMYNYPYWGSGREAWLSKLAGGVGENNIDYREFTLTGGTDIFPELLIGGNYIYGFQFVFNDTTEVPLPRTRSTITDNYAWGSATGQTTVNITGKTTITPVITVTNENVGINTKYSDWYTPGAELTVTYGSTTKTYSLNNGENTIDSITIPSGGLSVTFKFDIDLTSDPNAKAVINYGGQYATIKYRGGEL